MLYASLIRHESSSEGTFGKLIVLDRVFHSAELPWWNNQTDVSCIPLGEYTCTWHQSSRYGWTYLVNDVPGRTHILFHVGNWAGDDHKGYRTDSNGCILLGLAAGEIYGQKAILQSTKAIKEFNGSLNQRAFRLIISSGGFNATTMRAERYN